MCFYLGQAKREMPRPRKDHPQTMSYYQDPSRRMVAEEQVDYHRSKNERPPPLFSKEAGEQQKYAESTAPGFSQKDPSRSTKSLRC